MNSKILLFTLMTLVMTTAYGRSGGVGNGGDAIVCKDSVTLLDSYEALKLGLTINLNNPNLQIQTHRSMVNMAVNRLAKKDKYTAKKLYDYATEMVNDLEHFKMFPTSTERYKGDVLYLGPDAVGEISDSDHRTLPIDCELRQLVSQKVPERRRDNRYEMNKVLWDQMSLVDQSMTILHEAWYRIMLEDGAKDSVGARYMNALTASEEFEKDNFSDYIEDLKTTEKQNYIIENHSTLIFDSLFKVNLHTSEFEFNQHSVCTKDLKVSANIKKVAFITNLHTGLAKIKFENVCFNNSTIESLTLPQNFSGKRLNFVMENYLLRTNGVDGNNGILKFNENGTFKELLNLDTEVLYKMFYICGRGKTKIKTFEKEKGCKGPYLLDDSKISNPGKVIFNENESPLDFTFPMTMN